MSGDIVIVDYADLVANDGGGVPYDEQPSFDELLSKLGEAFGSGPNSKGIIAIRNVPGFVSARDAFLPLAHPLAHLPSSYLESELTDARSLYNAGWSHGKEKLKKDVPDLSKGSFYFNPLTDSPGTEEERERYPSSYPCNVWPDEDKLPGGFEEKAKKLGRIMHGAVVALAGKIDAFASMRAAEGGMTYPPNLLRDAMRGTEKAKGRLLYYFPLDGDTQKEDDTTSTPPAEDSWIGWHNDSGFLTALAGDMYVEHDTGRRLDPVSEVDGEAGLYAVDRNGGTVKVTVPDDCVAVQIGECTQIVTGGAVVATPHCVRGARGGVGRSSSSSPPRVARISCPCFIDTPPSFPLRSPGGRGGRERVLSVGLGTDRVPPLEGRWTEDGMAFGDFLARTFETYYDWNNKDDDGEEE